MMKLLRALGVITKDQALIEGYQYHGSYYGIPVWLGDVESDCMLVAAKWKPLEGLMTLFHYIEGFMFPLVHGFDAEPCFQFKIFGDIE